MRSYDDFAASILLEQGVVSARDHERSLRHAAETGVGPCEALMDMGVASARDVAIARAVVCECPFVDLERFEIDSSLAARVPRVIAEKHLAIPLFETGGVVTIGMADPLDLAGVDQLRALLRTDMEAVLCEPMALGALIARAYALRGEPTSIAQPEPGHLESAAPDDEPLVAAVDQILAQAIDERASDIHISPDEQQTHLRFRIDGVLHVRPGPPAGTHARIVQRLKVMARLDLTQNRRPQDGKFRVVRGKRAVDVRLSIVPTVTGENVVMRLLTGSGAAESFEELGMPPAIADEVGAAIDRPHGMLLVTGPTGSGKTTTLYTALARLNAPSRNIITIEDPVEIRLPLVRHMQVNAEIGVTFAAALRAVLRQDPDVILVGEIRDDETARTAVQAALTGHLVLSTLHTNDAPGAVARLADLGCPPFAINAALSGAIAQRLVRRVCERCAASEAPDAALLARFAPGESLDGARRGRGCSACMGGGYRGRVGVFEFMPMTPALRLAVEGNASSASLRAVAIEQGMRPLWRDGLDKVRTGMTTLDEVARVATGLEDAHARPRLSA